MKWGVFGRFWEEVWCDLIFIIIDDLLLWEYRGELFSLVCEVKKKLLEECFLNVEGLGRFSWVKVGMEDGGCVMYF